MAQNSQGIQTLLEAEKEASKIVAKSRQYRVQRLKDARTEASKEIEALKAQKTREFQDFEKQFAGDSDESVIKAQAHTEQALIDINTAFAKNKEAVIQNLLAAIVKCEPTVHANVRPAKST
ncbi:H+-ATPase G subunit-domain-containing protein [Entophlyctis helioformis]|nr:H+-ATPase G subunit-domain-containing protein [Entophlyctis helioformis]